MNIKDSQPPVALGVNPLGNFVAVGVDAAGAITHTLTREAWRSLYAAAALIARAADPRTHDDTEGYRVLRAFDEADLMLEEQERRQFKP